MMASSLTTEARLGSQARRSSRSMGTSEWGSRSCQVITWRHRASRTTRLSSPTCTSRTSRSSSVPTTPASTSSTSMEGPTMEVDIPCNSSSRIQPSTCRTTPPPIATSSSSSRCTRRRHSSCSSSQCSRISLRPSGSPITTSTRTSQSGALGATHTARSTIHSRSSRAARTVQCRCSTRISRPILAGSPLPTACTTRRGPCRPCSPTTGAWARRQALIHSSKSS